MKGHSIKLQTSPVMYTDSVVRDIVIRKRWSSIDIALTQIVWEYVVGILCVAHYRVSTLPSLEPPSHAGGMESIIIKTVCSRSHQLLHHSTNIILRLYFVQHQQIGRAFKDCSYAPQIVQSRPRQTAMRWTHNAEKCYFPRYHPLHSDCAEEWYTMLHKRQMKSTRLKN